MLFKFYTFVQEINKEKGSNYKMSVLERYKDDEDIKYLLNFIYNPYIITGISDKKLQKTIENPSSFDLLYIDSLRGILEYLKTHNTGRDCDILQARTFLSDVIMSKMKEDPTLPTEAIYLFNNIITKNVILGFDVLTINKVIPGLIPTFNVQLANKYFDKPEVVEGKEFALTTKIDGGRIIALKQGDEVSFWTRAGQRYEGLVDLENELRSLPLDDICLDGEITLLNPYVVENDLWTNEPAIGRKMSSKEQYKETMKITRKDGEKHGVKMLVFDFMPASDFEKQVSTQTYRERRRWLDMLPQMTYFEVLPVLYQGKDTSQITKWLNHNIENGEEGVMINMVDDYYQFKRSNSLLKVKKMNDIDLPILDFEEGSNQYEGSLGALITEYKGCKLKVGSGISKELRQEIWNHKEDYRGLTMVVQYFEETTNQNGGVSLRFPILLDIRYDV